ncbi:MAG TPA: hypothetical protein VFO30_01440 [Chthoniobacterales bacterium]|nr:hypothetical protein [Chthoniobacterales bacterium]
MKKLLLIAGIAGAFMFAATPSRAGVSVGIGIGFPVGYAYPYPPYPYPYPYYAPGPVYFGPSFYWYHGYRVYYPRHRRYRYLPYYRY